MNPLPLFAATGPYGLVGLGLFEHFPGLAPLDVAPPPPEAGARFKNPPTPVDITDAGRLSAALAGLRKVDPSRPLLVVHLAAITDTKGTDDALYEKVNVQGTRNVLEAVLAAGGHLIPYFDGLCFRGRWEGWGLPGGGETAPPSRGSLLPVKI